MARSSDAIRVRIRARDEEPSQTESAKEAFWQPLRRQVSETSDVEQNYSNRSFGSLEGQLEHGLGPALRTLLLHKLTDGYRGIEPDLYGDRVLSLFDRLFHFPERRDF